MNKSKLRSQIAQKELRIDQQLDLFTNRLDEFLFLHISQNLKKIRQVDGVKTLVRKLNDLEIKLNDRGLSAKIADIDEVYKISIVNIAKRLKLAAAISGKTFDNIDQEVIRSIIDFDVNRIEKHIGEYVSNVRSQVYNIVLTGQPINFDTIHKSVGQNVLNNIRTEANTAVAGFETTVTLYKAKKLNIKLFAYVGGLIKTSRPFCRDRDGRVFTLKQINNWDNGQGLPANIYRGGYNCRHDLVPISEGVARAEFDY